MNGSKKNLKCLSHEKRKSLIDHDIEIGLGRQCELLGISRSSLYYEPKPISEEQLKLLKLIECSPSTLYQWLERRKIQKY